MSDITVGISEDIGIVRLLIRSGADPDTPDSLGNTALTMACLEEHLVLLRVLLEEGADANAPNADGTTPLDWTSDPKLIRLLLSHGARFWADEHGNSRLHTAAGNGLDELLKTFLDCGVSPDIESTNGATPLLFAAYWGQANTARLLLQAGADPDARDASDLSPLMWAARQGHTEVVRVLLDAGVDPNTAVCEEGGTPLMYAAAAGSLETLQLLLAYGADAAIADKHGRTASSLASECGHMSIVEALKRSLAQPSAQIGRRSTHSISPEETTKGVAANELPDLHSTGQELNSLIGLQNVKQTVAQYVNYLRFQQMRQQQGLAVPEQSLHMVFTGNPGTGKTTIARLMAQIYRCLGILHKGHLVETDRSGLVAGYLGQTALKVREVVQEALGGVLFVDEAYSITQDSRGDDSFGQEAVDTLVKLMEDHRHELVVIVAGYTEPMQRFIRSNPGLQSRFNKFLHFEDYSPEELTAIFAYFAAKSDYRLQQDAQETILRLFTTLHARRDETFGNARLARNLFESAVNRHANRMMMSASIDRDSMVTLYPEDIVQLG